MKKLTKKIIINTFRRTKEEAKIIMEYQRKFPELLEDIDGFIINSKILWEKLGNPQGQHSMWIDRKIKKKFELDNDYIAVKQNCVTGQGNSNNENIAMLTFIFVSYIHV